MKPFLSVTVHLLKQVALVLLLLITVICILGYSWQ